MKTYTINSNGNPLSDLISDDVWQLLNSNGLIHEKSVRDYQIRKKFFALKARGISSTDSILALRNEYPYLQFDTLRKIVYGTY